MFRSGGGLQSTVPATGLLAATWSAAVRKSIANRSAIHTLVALLREHAPAFQSAPPKRRVASRARPR